VNNGPFRPKEKYEELLGLEVPYLSGIGVLMYLANYAWSDILFPVNLLARYSSSPTQRHWNGVKHIFCYLIGTMDMGLFYTNVSKSDLIDNRNATYLSYPYNGRSRKGYFLTCGDSTISWWFVKQTVTTTSSNHAKF